MDEVVLRQLKLVVCFVTVALVAQAGEFVVLSNGFRIHANSHSADGPVIRLETNQGLIEIQANTVTAFEQEDYTPAGRSYSDRPASQPAESHATGTDHASRSARRSAAGHCA